MRAKCFGVSSLPSTNGLIDDPFSRDIGQFASLPRLDLFSRWLEIPLHPVDAD